MLFFFILHLIPPSEMSVISHNSTIISDVKEPPHVPQWSYNLIFMVSNDPWSRSQRSHCKEICARLLLRQRDCASLQHYKKCNALVSWFCVCACLCHMLLRRHSDVCTPDEMLPDGWYDAGAWWLGPLAKCRQMQMCKKENRPHGNYCSNSKPCRKALRHSSRPLWALRKK